MTRASTADEQMVLHAPVWMADLHREIGDAGIGALLRLHMKHSDSILGSSNTALLSLALDSLKKICNLAESNICMHENTHRGGVLWEICDRCGARWADDEGGKPEYHEHASITQAHKTIDALKEAIAAIASAPSTQKAQGQI